MTTCADIVRMGMAQIRLLRGGESPSGQEGEDGLVVLQSMYDQMVTDGMFGRLYDTIPSAAYTAQEQDRVINDGNYVITLPLTITPTIPSGSYYPLWPENRTWAYYSSSVPRPPLDLSLIEVVANNAVQRNLYDNLTRAWVRIDSLALTDTAPLANRGAIGLAAAFVDTWANQFGEQIDPVTAKNVVKFKWGISAKYEDERVANRTPYF